MCNEAGVEGTCEGKKIQLEFIFWCFNVTDEESESASEQPAQGSFLNLLPSRFEVSKPGDSRT